MVKIITTFIIVLFFTTSWYNFNFDILGRTITNLSEFIVILLFFLLFSKTPYLFNDRKLVRYITFFIITGLSFFLYSNFILSLPLDMSIGTLRRLFIYPIIGILCGRLLFYYYANRCDIIIHSIKIYILIIPLILFLDIFLFEFYHSIYIRYIPRLDAFLSFFLILYFYENIHKQKHSILYFSILVIYILLTLSRGVYLSIAIFYLLYIVIRRGIFETWRYVAVLSSSILILTFILPTNSVVADLISKKIIQVSDFLDGYEGSSGYNSSSLDFRYYRYISAFQSGLESPIIGKGLGYKEDFYIAGNYNRYEEEKTAHNFLLTIWYKMGLIGIVCYCLFLFFISKRINYLPAKILFFSAYFYSLFDVMMTSTPSAIYSIYIISGYYYSE